MTPEAAILAALNARLAALPSGFPPILWREKGDDLPAEYIMVDHLPNLSSRPMLDSPAQDLLGIYRLTLARKPGQYEIVYREQAAKIAAHFMDAVTLTADGKTVTITKADVRQGRSDGTRWAVPVDIHYRLDA